MRVRDLGALLVVVDTQEQPIVGSRAAAMLALLTINANQRVSVDALMEAAWGDRITPGAASTLTSHIWKLRQVLEPGRDRRQPPSVLVNDSDGYRLVCGPSTVDSLLLAEAAGEVRDLLAAGHAEPAVRRAESALGLWRGTPYGAFAEADWASTAVARLEELRGQLQERRIVGLLASGAVDAALSDLPPLIAAMPYRESLRACEMEALYRGGRGEEALEAYAEARRTLVDEVGVEPGPHLQELHRRILQNDPTLIPPTPAPRAASSPRPVEVHLPLTLTSLVGRADVLGRLTELVRTSQLVTVIGAAGCGKTRIAVEVARAVAQEFPDGVWFVDLTAVSDPDLVVDATVSTIGFAGSTGATPLQDLRRYLQHRRMLLVLDNCEHVLDSVDQLVRVTLGDPGATPECSFLITSREPIGLDGETIWTLDPLGLPDPDAADDPTEAPAVELFLQRLASAAPTLPVDEQVLARAAEISIALDGLPLPLELAAARALSHSLDDIAAQVAADPTRLSRVGRGPHDHRATVRSAIEWSHRLLSPPEQRAHRRLSVLPGAFTADVAEAVIGEDSADEVLDADDLLAQLVHRSLLTSEGARGVGRPTSFRQLATVRSHGHHALVDADENRRILDRRDDWTAALVAARPPLGTFGEVEWYHRIDDDYAGVRATLARHLIDEPSAEGGRLAYQLTYYWYYRERLVEAGRWLALGHQALLGDGQNPTDALVARISVAMVLVLQRRLDLARPHLEGLDALLRATPPDRLADVGEGLVGLAMAMYVCEEPALLRDQHALLTRVVGEAGDANLALLTDAVGCCSLLLLGQLDAAVALALTVQDRAERQDNLTARWVSTAPLIIGALHSGRPAEGIPWVERCLATHLQLGTGSIGLFTETRANFAAQLGDYAQATRTYAASRIATRRAGLVWPNREHTSALLAMTRDQLGRVDYERAWQEGEKLSVAELFGDPGRVGPAVGARV